MAQTKRTQSASLGDGKTHCGNTTRSFSATGSFNITQSFNNFHKSDDDAKIMTWLSPLAPNNRHEGVRTDRFTGVGSWLLETTEFREWRGGEGGFDKAVLFGSGNPGVGKTYLSSLVIDSLCDRAKVEDFAVAGLYCDFLAQQEQTSTNMIGAILKQLIGRGCIPKYIREAFEEGKTELGGRRLLLPDLVGMLRIAIAARPRVFICIDALDEYLPKRLPELLKLLRDIVRESPTTRIFLTGRPHIREDIQRYFSKAVVTLISPNIDDIRHYLEMRLDGDTDPEAMGSDLRADIVRVILEKISDVFLLVSLNMDAILGEVTISQRRKKLEEIAKGNGLGDAYTATLTRIKAQKGNKSILGLKVLMWVLYSERPLRADELCHALGVEVGSPDLDVENVPALRTLVASCLGLVTVEASSSTVRLVHYTLQEHLSNDPTLFHSPHSTIAEVCLTYLNFKCVRDLSPTLRLAPAEMPLLEYASCYWGMHTRREMTENTKVLALGLLDGFDEHISAQVVLLCYNRNKDSGPYFSTSRGPLGFTGLHGAAFLGVVGIVAAILVKGCDVNTTDSTGSTALTWAAARGHEEVAKVLLNQKDINPDQAETRYNRTPLSWAAGNGHDGIVKMLLERGDVRPEQAGTKYGRAPLSWAAANGHEGVVKMFLELGHVNPNQKDNYYGRTPLLWAAGSGHEGVIKMLLERGDVSPDQADTKYGQTPLSRAAENGHEEVVKMFLERGDINPDQADTEYGRTPLSWAAENGNGSVVKMLLGRDCINANRADTKYGRTPLSWGAKYGHAEVVKMLLERGDVNPDQADTECGQTPLLLAAENGHERVVKILLERGDVHPARADSRYHRTLLWWAAKHGYEGVVRVLLERKDINPDQPDIEYGQTPLLLAAESWHEGIVKMLLERKDVHPARVDTKYGRTLLWWVARHGHEGVLRMLLERGDVKPDHADTKYGRTPLSLSAEKGHVGVVKILLDRGDVNPNQADTEYGRTPLSWAAENGHEEVVKILLERDEVNSDHPDSKCGRTPLSLSAGNGHVRVVKMLLEREGVNLNRADTGYGWTPLSWAARNGHTGVVKMLLKRGDVNPDPVDVEYGRTPLSWATMNGHEGVVKLLLERKDVCTTTIDRSNQTPLSIARSRRHYRVVWMLLERDFVNSDTANRVAGHPS